MANKLTKEKLELLIEQVLSEKTNYPIDPNTDVVGRTGIFGNKYIKMKSKTGLDDDQVKLRIANLANLDEPKTKLTNLDFDDAAAKDRSSEEYQTAKLVGKYGRNTAIRKPAVDAGITQAYSDQTTQDIGTTFDPDQEKQDVTKTIPDTDLDYFAQKSESETDFTSFKPMAKLSQSTADVFESFFQGTNANTVQKRLDEIAKFSKLIFQVSKASPTDAQKASLQGRGAQQIMNDAIIVKCLSKVAREIQGGSAGTVFETFLAVLLGGVITGGSGAAGDLGIVGKPIYLSSKFEAGLSGGQSSKNVQNELKTAETIWYIGANKKAGREAVNVGGAMQVDIHLSGVQLKDNKATSGNQTFIFIDKQKKKIGNEQAVSLRTGSKISIQYNTSPDYTIYLGNDDFYAQGGQTFDKMFNEAVGKLDVVIKTAIEEMSSVYQSSDKITQKMKTYIGKSDIDAGIEVKDTYMAMLGTLNNVFATIQTKDAARPDQTVSKIKGTLSEKNKTKSLKDLDKLIEHVILNKMNK